jgi:hypothetical protein
MFKFLCILLLATNCVAGERIVQQDERGNNLYHKQQYIATHGKMCPINAAGYREHHKPCIIVSKDVFTKLTKDLK